MGSNFYVYVYKDPISLIPFYVGKGTASRMMFHIGAARQKRKGKTELACIRYCRKLLKSGLEPIIEKIIDNIDEQEAFNLEVHYIKLYGRIDNKSGTLLNNTDGGEGSSGLIQSKDHIEKRVRKLKGRTRSENQKQYIRIKTLETRQKISDKLKGRHLSLEHRKRISESQIGRKINEDIKKRISETCKQKGIKGPGLSGKDHPRSKGGTLRMPNGEIIYFDCLVTFCQEHNLNVSSVRNTLSQNRPLKRGEYSGLQLLSRTE